MKAAASGMKLPLAAIQAAKAAGCPAFRSNRIYEAELREWIKANPKLVKKTAGNLREIKLKEEIRKLKLANDLREGRLIERAWMAERLLVAVGRVDAYRLRSEAEHPLRFAAAAGDVAACREVIQEIWNEIMAAHHECQSAFEPTK